MDKSAGELAGLARSWSHPPEIKVNSKNVIPEGYSVGERCYNLKCHENGTEPFDITIDASEESPLVNLAMVLKNWGDADVKIQLNGEQVEQSKDFRFGHERTEKGINLIIWLKVESFEPVQISLFPNS
jgi:hypothetical protein